MRRLALFSALLVLELAACKHKPRIAESREDIKAPASKNQIVITTPVLSALKMSDPDAARELVAGFYGLESGTWRWTASKFVVALLPPQGAAQNGARLEFKFSLPEVIANKLGPLTLSAKVNGFALPSQPYSKAGEYIYTAAIPPETLRSGIGYLEFSTDKAMPPDNGDKRELALVAVSVALLPVGRQTR
jgi:hypothetical protein